MQDLEQQRQYMQRCDRIQIEDVVRALLDEFGALTEYRILRDGLPGRLAVLLKCRRVLLYQRMGETLQMVAGSFDDEPGWSEELLAVAHINPIDVSGDGPEARAWRERHIIGEPEESPILVALPLIYRHRGMGIMAALRGESEKSGEGANIWTVEEIEGLDVVANVVALLLENTRLLERDRERIHELSLLNSISNQMNGALYEQDRLRNIIIQRAKEISLADLCALIEPNSVAEKENAWISPVLRVLLLQHFREQQTPLIIERPGDGSDPASYLQYLPQDIKTFYAIPLLNSQEQDERQQQMKEAQEAMPMIPGIIVGAYQRLWTLRREEMVVLQVFANQASVVLRNVQLMAELVEARNEARKLLRRVMDDQRLKALILASIPSGLITTDLNGHIVTFNEAAEAILGYHSYEVLGRPLEQFLRLKHHPFLQPEEQEQQRTRQSEDGAGEKLRQAQSETVILLDRRGEEVIVDVDVLPLWSESSESIGWLVTFVDMTSVRHLEEEKRRLDRLAALGEMSANVAHEVRNPLASIKTAMQLLASELVSDSTIFPENALQRDDGQESARAWALESIGVVLREVERLDTIVRELLQFARPRQLHRSSCNIVELSDRVLRLLQRQYSEANIVVRRMYTPIPAILIDVAQMEQVLLNLYMNAIQAMPDGGSLTVTCRLITKRQAMSEAREAQVALAGPSMREGGQWQNSAIGKGENKGEQWLELAISDTGPGIAPDQRENIFRPFFTTRAHGIGLGLAITRRLVEDHGGYIWVGGQAGYGATLSVRLPLLPELREVNEEGNDVEKERT